MKMVVELPDEIKQKRDEGKVLSSEEIATVCLAIKNGTPLPKGHGRLIDADAFKRNVCTYQQTGCGECKHALCCPDDVSTIIEADGGDAE